MRYGGFIKILFIGVALVSCKDPGIEKPEDNRFSKETIIENLDEPMQFEVLKDNRILFVERKGKIKLYDPVEDKTRIIADIPVSIGYYSEEGEELSPTGEDGLYGAILDPEFDTNKWIYVYYAPQGGEHRSLLSRFEWIGDSLDMGSEIILLEIPNQRISCCHLGGGLLFDPKGNLLITTGDNTPNDPRGYTPIDMRDDRSRFDAQRTSSNPNDLRGKILRIRPEEDGTYSIPEGNLFRLGTPGTRPEIYTMGNRNPWRLSLDSETNWIFWGEVGPNGVKDSMGLGPRSYDEFNIAKKAGNYGWPYFVGDNKAYWAYDYSTNTPGNRFNPKNPVNNSPNNTGIRDLPRAEPAFIWYPQTISNEFPLMGSGSNSAVGGPIFRRADFPNSSSVFPSYYEGKWFITDWTRGWILLVSFDRQGNFESMEEFIPELKLNGPIDMKFGPTGELYVLEYGRGPYKLNPEARLIRLVYNAGNRPPIPAISVDKVAGAAPLTVSLSSEETIDPDQDPLDFEWTVKLDNQIVKTFKEANLKITLKEPGNYLIELQVTDSEGASANKSLEIAVGNDPPVVGFYFGSSNKNFYFPGDTIEYKVEVVDSEDGSLNTGQIPPERISVNIEYVNHEEEGLNDIIAHLKEIDAMIPFQSVVASKIINKSDCKSCHAVNENLIGPSYSEISKKYTIGERQYLIDKIIKGGSGVWDSKMAMPAHPEINEIQAGSLVDYIIGLGEKEREKDFSVNDTYIVPKINGNIYGSPNLFKSLFYEKFLFRASYLDKGSQHSPGLLGSDIVILRNPVVPITSFDKYHEVEINHAIAVTRSSVIAKKSGAFIGLNQIDLTGISELKLDILILPESIGNNFGNIEVRLNSPGGKLIGALSLIRTENGKNISSSSIKINEIQGIYDLYITFVSKSDHDNISYVQLRSIEFKK